MVVFMGRYHPEDVVLCCQLTQPVDCPVLLLCAPAVLESLL
jgi:hypothetical protein